MSDYTILYIADDQHSRGKILIKKTREYGDQLLTLALIMIIFQISLNWTSYASELSFALDKASDIQLALQEAPLLPVAGSDYLPQTQIQPPDYRIIIPKINQNVPIVSTPVDMLLARDWVGLEEAIQDDLKNGVVHYPGTANPGDTGNVVLTGHSSYYPWDDGRYKSVFALLGKMEIGDEFQVYQGQTEYKYKIVETKVVKPDQVEVLKQSQDKKITLITCVPLGTNLRRLVVTAKQI